MTKELHEQDPAEMPGETERSAAQSQGGADAAASGEEPMPGAAEPTEAEPNTGEPGEEAGAASAETSAEANPAELRMLLEDARAKADDAHNQVLRVRAEMENMGRRQSKELENAHKFALEGFMKELLQVRDSLELGKAAAQAPDADVEKLREGTELTLKLLSDVMAKFGVERIEPDGEPFNPDYHQAMSIQPRSDVPPNTVVNVVQSGYTLNGRLVRPALVMVSQAA